MLWSTSVHHSLVLANGDEDGHADRGTDSPCCQSYRVLEWRCPTARVVFAVIVNLGQDERLAIAWPVCALSILGLAALHVYPRTATRDTLIEDKSTRNETKAGI